MEQLYGTLEMKKNVNTQSVADYYASFGQYYVLMYDIDGNASKPHISIFDKNEIFTEIYF